MAFAPSENDGEAQRGLAVGRAVWALGWAAIAVLGVLSPLLDLSRSPGFRDAGHYYGPLYAWQAEQWRQGVWPLWNPMEDSGRSLAADPTAATFYPLKLLLAMLPGSWTWRWHLYLALHVIIASCGAAWCARRLKSSLWGASVAAMAYGTSSIVVSQIDNVVFLVGAAWLPWALGWGYQALAEGRFAAIAGSALALAMIVLGGDPQGAVHALLALGVLVLVDRSTLSRDLSGAPQRHAKGPMGLLERANAWISSRRILLLRLSFILIAAVAASAVQVIPAWRAAASSERRLHRDPRSVSEALSDAWTRSDRTPREKLLGTLRGWFGKPMEGTHHQYATQFSVPPWQFAELLWPTVSGRGAPVDRRWTEALPASDRVWFPTLHIGTAAFLLALLGWGVRSPAGREQRWCSWGALFFASMALGWYGPGWLWQESVAAMSGAENVPFEINGSIGGTHWWVSLLVPGYAEFRYPAKAMVPAAFFLAMLSARGIEMLRAGNASRLTYVSLAALVLSMGAAIAAWMGEDGWRSLLENRRPDAIWGPFDLDGAWHDLIRGLAHGGMIAGMLLVFSRAFANHQRGSSRWKIGVGGLITIIAIETLVARHDAILTAPSEAWNLASPLAVIHDNPKDDPASQSNASPRFYRSLDETWTPPRWWRTRDQGRLDEVIAWDRMTWFPKHHLPDEGVSIETPGSSQDGARWLAFQIARGKGFENLRGSREPDPDWLSALGASWLVVPAEDEGLWGEARPHLARYEPRGDWPESLVLLHDPQALREAWLVRRSRWLALPEDSGDLDAWWRLIDRLFRDPRYGPRGWREAVVLHAEESDHPEAKDILAQESDRDSSDDSLRLASRSLHRSEWQIAVSSPAWLVVSEAWNEDWTCRIEGEQGTLREATPIRANLVMKAVRVQPGDRRVIWEYRPAWFSTSLLISTLTGVGLLLTLLDGSFGRSRLAGWRKKTPS